jgi:P-type conjugative transfer protein TrbJ
VLLDAFVLVAHLIDEPAADEVAAMLHDRDDPPVVNAVNLAETIDRSSRVGGLELVDVVQRITWLRDGGLEVLAVDAFDGAVLAPSMTGAISNMAQQLKQIEQYRLQLQQYVNMLQNTMNPGLFIWDNAQETMNDLRYMIDTVSFYRQLYGTVAGFTGNFHDMAWYRNAQCFKEPGCSPSQWGLILENEVIGAQSQKKSIEALFRGLERQYDTLNLDSRRLKRLQLAAQTSSGQAEVMQHNNMLTSEGANQLMQIRAALLAQQNMDATRQQAQADREAMQMAADRNARQGTFQPSPRRAW